MPTAAGHTAAAPMAALLLVARHTAGLSRRQVGEAAGLWPNDIYKWETGAPRTLTVDSLARWAAALGYDLALIPHDTEEAP